MVLSTHDGMAKNVTDGPNGTWCRHILLRGQMRASLVVGFHIRQQCVLKISFAQDDDMINALSADQTDQFFSISVLP
jgi:hypothetical protein